MKTWMLGAALLAGAAAVGATQAQAAEFGVVVRGPSAYVPPSPGPGYGWVAGYTSGGYWVPGRWELRGGAGWGREHVVAYGGPGFDRRGYDRHDYDRHDYGRGNERGRR